MEQSIKNKITVAAFIFLGVVMFTVAIFVLGGKENLFTSTFRLHAAFETVSGLKQGSSVRFNGINVGLVDRIDITGVDRVTVTMTLESNVKPFIKKDSKATVISEGLVGNKIIEITPGSASIPAVQDGETIETIKPVDTEDILRSLKETGENASTLTKDLADVVSKVNKGEGTIGQLLTNDQLYRSVDSTMRGFSGYTGQVNEVFNKITGTIDNVSSDINLLTKGLKDITSDISEVTRKMNSSESIVGTLLTDTVFANNLKEVISNASMTTKNLESGSYSFSQNMEALKHNFFFKGYFEDVGYWDKADFEKKIQDHEQKLRMWEQRLNEREKMLKEMEEKMKQDGVN